MKKANSNSILAFCQSKMSFHVCKLKPQAGIHPERKTKWYRRLQAISLQ
jgi:(2Fe-2S) ferredoxin